MYRLHVKWRYGLEPEDGKGFPVHVREPETAGFYYSPAIQIFFISFREKEHYR